MKIKIKPVAFHRIVEIMESKELTEKQVREIIGENDPNHKMGYDAFYDIRVHERNTSVFELQQIMKALNVSWSEIIDQERCEERRILTNN